MSTIDVLNPRLYRALQAAFGDHVRVENAGERRQVLHLPDWNRGGRLRATSVHSGEHYAVDCCFCQDTRQRLYFNHEWAERDPETGEDNLHLVKCFNEDCIRTRPRQLQLLHLVYPFGHARQETPAEPAAVAAATEPPPAPRLPGGLILPVNRLAPAHPASVYLAERRFDLDYLWNTWRVQYCEYSADVAPQITQRIVIPVFTLLQQLEWSPAEQQLAGWQARCIGPCPDGVPKYLSCRGMRKSQLLYGLHVAIQSSGPVVVVEGPTDVWRLGTNAVALFGKDMSAAQQQLLERYFRGRPVVVFLDRDARENAEALRRRLRTAGRPVVLAEPPDGRGDVGDCTRDEAWQQVNLALGQLR